MKCYDQAPDEVRDRVIALIKRYHPELEKVQIRIDLLMASTDSDETAAVTCGGYPAYAVVKILGPKERAMDRGDAEIVIDRDEYEAMDAAKRDALLDHELYHLEVKRDKNGRPKMDDHQRPCLKMRKHDFQVGWFHEIARRHGFASIEVSQATALREEQGQTYFVYDSTVENLQAMRPDGCDSVEITSSGADGKKEGVRIDATGIHAIGETPETFEEPAIEEAIAIVTSTGIASVSILQRRMRLGYRRAFALMSELEKRGIVGPENGSSPREILKAFSPSAA